MDLSAPPVGIVAENGLSWQHIRPLSVSHTTVVLPPERWDATLRLPSGWHTSNQTMVCFEPNHALLRVEPLSTSSRTTLREACVACTSATAPWHETYRTGLPEDRIAKRTGHIAPGRQVVGGSAERGEEYTVLPVQAAGETGGGSSCRHRVSRLRLIKPTNQQTNRPTNQQTNFLCDYSCRILIFVLYLPRKL